MKRASAEQIQQWHAEAIAAGAKTRTYYETPEGAEACDLTACFLIDMASSMYDTPCWTCNVCAASSRQWWRTAAWLPGDSFSAVVSVLRTMGKSVPPLVLEAR